MRRLLVQPAEDFPLDYEEAAITEITRITNGQPFLVQLIGQNLVTHYNRQRFEEALDREALLTQADLQAVLATEEFFIDGDYYFNGVWAQASQSDPPEQTLVLQALCRDDFSQPQQALSVAELAARAQLTPECVRKALDTLLQHDVVLEVEEREPSYRYAVELMEQWVARRQK